VLALTSKITTQEPHFIEIGHTMPADLPVEIAQRARETVSAALLATGMRWGVFHVEFWLDQEHIVLGELHARSGGDNLHPMTELVTGIDLYGVVLDQLAQKTVDPADWDLYQRGAAMRYVVVPPGRVTAISGLEDVNADPACVQAKLALRVGDESKPMTSSLDRHGFVFATGKTAREAGENAERLCRHIHVDVEPLTAGSAQAKQ
jgi:biotin carboxylase